MSTQQALPQASIPPETLGDRMRRALRKEGMSVQEMADYLGVSRNTVGTWINDHIRPGEQTFKLWAIRTGVPLEWLKEGEVSPFPDSRLADSSPNAAVTLQYGGPSSITRDDLELAA